MQSGWEELLKWCSVLQFLFNCSACFRRKMLKILAHVSARFCLILVPLVKQSLRGEILIRGLQLLENIIALSLKSRTFNNY